MSLHLLIVIPFDCTSSLKVDVSNIEIERQSDASIGLTFTFLFLLLGAVGSIVLHLFTGSLFNLIGSSKKKGRPFPAEFFVSFSILITLLILSFFKKTLVEQHG